MTLEGKLNIQGISQPYRTGLVSLSSDVICKFYAGVSSLIGEGAL